MRRVCYGFALASVALFGGSASMAPAFGAPPTVTPSPGYDARLQEQRAAQTYSAPLYEPVVRDPRPLRRHHARRTHDRVH